MPSELDVQRKLTHTFILTRPITVVLKPRVKQRQPSGGFAWANGVPRAPQVMRLCDPPTVAQEMPRPVNAQDGVQRTIEFMLLGEWNAEIGINDVFEYDGHQWEIIQLAQDNGWERRASVARYG